MVTIEELRVLDVGDIVYQVGEYNADGTPRRWRVSGMLKQWKLRPDEYRLPIKFGLYRSAAIVPSLADHFTLIEPMARQASGRRVKP